MTSKSVRHYKRWCQTNDSELSKQSEAQAGQQYIPWFGLPMNTYV